MADDRPTDSLAAAAPTWREPDGTPIACEEKLLVLNENLEESGEVAQEALEDAILMGVDEAQVREVLRATVDALVNPYGKD